MLSTVQPIEQSPATLTRPSGRRARLGRLFKRAAKKLLPDVVAQELRNWRAYKKTERPIYLKLKVLNSIGWWRKAEIPTGARSFLFVCSGNIIRSPMCEALMKRALAEFPQCTVMSAGLNTVPDRAAHSWAVAAAQELGISLHHHRARLFTSEMVEHADLVFAMDYENQVQLLSGFPQSKNKILLLRAFSGERHGPFEIRDPYYIGLEETERCYRVLTSCIKNLADKLQVNNSTRA